MLLANDTPGRRSHRSSLGYEPCDVRLWRLGRSRVAALTSADLPCEVVSGAGHPLRLALSRHVRFTDPFTERALALVFPPFGRSGLFSGVFRRTWRVLCRP